MMNISFNPYQQVSFSGKKEKVGKVLKEITPEFVGKYARPLKGATTEHIIPKRSGQQPEQLNNFVIMPKQK
jgi:hypothetical protein